MGLRWALVFISVVTTTAAPENGEPGQCYSRFDYEYKVLQHLVTLKEAEKELRATTFELQNTVKALEEKVKDHYQVNQPMFAFSATTVTNRSPFAHERLLFSDVLLNVGGVYDAETGKFTAPVNGTFAFTFSLCTDKRKAAAFQIKAEDKIISREFNSDRLAASSVSSYAIAVLNKGEKVWVETEHADGVSLYWSAGLHCWNRFSGHILRLF